MLEKDSNQSVAQHESGSPSEAKERHFNLIVNGSPERWEQEMISFEQVVRLAFPTDPSPNTIYTVTYKGGPRENPEGGLVLGQSVVVKSGMKFYVTPTGQS